MRQYENDDYDTADYYAQTAYSSLNSQYEAQAAEEQEQEQERPDYHVSADQRVSALFDTRYGVSVFAPDNQDPPF